MLEIGQIYRYSRPYSATPEVIGGYRNFFSVTQSPGCPLALLEKGINPIASVKTSSATRVPAILISSSPHKTGSRQTPWQDFFDSDNGHIRYFGDAKTKPTSQKTSPHLTPGNAVLLRTYEVQSTQEVEKRMNAVPLLFFERVRRGGLQKGFLKFHGFGVISRVELITQFDQAHGQSFSNYAYDFSVLSMVEENECFSWQWISDRRDTRLPVKDTLNHAPHSWKRWLKEGHKSLFKFTRSVAKQRVVPAVDQRPLQGSTEAAALLDIYKFYIGRKHRFELLAAEVTRKILQESGGTFHNGWITPPSGDGGADFIGRLDLGSGFATTKVVVLGQAKCESLNSPTSGVSIARTVARLRRGWIGVYVTTSYFSDRAQQEVIEDQYPIVLVHGRRLAEEVIKLKSESGHKTIDQYLTKLDAQYSEQLAQRRPEEILLAL